MSLQKRSDDQLLTVGLSDHVVCSCPPQCARCRQMQLCPLILLLDIDIGLLFNYDLATLILITAMLDLPT